MYSIKIYTKNLIVFGFAEILRGLLRLHLVTSRDVHNHGPQSLRVKCPS